MVLNSRSYSRPIVGISFDNDSSSFSLSDVDNCRMQPFIMLLESNFCKYNSPTNLAKMIHLVLSQNKKYSRDISHRLLLDANVDIAKLFSQLEELALVELDLNVSKLAS